MAETARLQLRMPLATARGAVAATLSDQGFVVHRRGDGLEVERASVIGGASAGEPVRFPVRFSQDGEGTEVEFVIEPATEPGAARVIVAAARVAADRLAERESAWTIDASADHALPARATPEPDGSVSAAPEQHGPTMETAPEAAASSPAADVREHDGSVPGDDAAATADRPASTSTLAILALILAFVAPVGGSSRGSSRSCGCGTRGSAVEGSRRPASSSAPSWRSSFPRPSSRGRARRGGGDGDALRSDGRHPGHALARPHARAHVVDDGLRTGRRPVLHAEGTRRDRRGQRRRVRRSARVRGIRPLRPRRRRVPGRHRRRGAGAGGMRRRVRDVRGAALRGIGAGRRVRQSDPEDVGARRSLGHVPGDGPRLRDDRIAVRAAR